MKFNKNALSEFIIRQRVNKCTPRGAITGTGQNKQVPAVIDVVMSERVGGLCQASVFPLTGLGKLEPFFGRPLSRGGRSLISTGEQVQMERLA